LPSFASELRRQLAARTGNPKAGGPHQRIELAGLVDAAGTHDDSGVTIRTPSAAVARSVVRLWRSEFGLEPRVSPSGPDSFGRARYVVRVEGNRAVQAAEELLIERERALRETGKRSGSPAGAAYLRGAFQGAGSVTRPGNRGGHHLEFVHADEEFVRRVTALSRAPLKIVRRRGSWVAYAKGVDGVTTLLAQMGLHEAVLEYEARAILGEAKANANRVTNFDAANAARTAAAAAHQQEILQNIDPTGLPEALSEMLALRLEHPDASLAELARLGGITKSAANHRLRRLSALGNQPSAVSYRQRTKRS
jgi:DNA-binding protein WhiA